MATTHLSLYEASKFALPDLIERVRAGEEISIEEDGSPAIILKSASPAMDPSVSATLERMRKLEDERGYPATVDAGFAEELEQIVAARAPGRGDPWAQ